MDKTSREESYNPEFLLISLYSAIGVFSTTLLILLHSMLEWGYDILYNLFNIMFLYYPILCICWILKFAYENKKLFSKPQIRNSMWITIVIIILLSLFQIGELYTVFKPEVLSKTALFTAYSENAIFHPLSLFFLICFFIYFRKKILGKKMIFINILHFFIFGSLLIGLFSNLSSKTLNLLEILGIWCENGIIFRTSFSILIIIILFLLRYLYNKFPHLFRKEVDNIGNEQ